MSAVSTPIAYLMRDLQRVTRAFPRVCGAIGRATVLAMVLGGCATRPASPGGFARCEGSTAPERWMLQPGGVLQGVVASNASGPLVGAIVRIQPQSADSVSGAREVRTASHGAFALDSMAPGTYVAHASATKHGVWTGTIELAEDRGTIPRIQLCTGRGG